MEAAFEFAVQNLAAQAFAYQRVQIIVLSHCPFHPRSPDFFFFSRCFTG
jgi:hypothetical protein